MRKQWFAVLCAALLALALPAAAEEANDETGIPVDHFPQGCIDCHVEGKAETIGALLAAMRHPNVDSDTETVPGDCADCHSTEGGFSTLAEFNHFLHYENPATNAFVQDYDGDCRHCHLLDPDTGDVTVKSGPRNW